MRAPITEVAEAYTTGHVVLVKRVDGRYNAYLRADWIIGQSQAHGIGTGALDTAVAEAMLLLAELKTTANA